MLKENQQRKEHIVFLGEAGFPVGLAAIQRMILMAKALLHEGCKVTVICRKGALKKNGPIHFANQGNFEGIDYLYTSKSIFKPKGFLTRNIQKLKGLYGEFKHIKYLKKEGKLDVAIITSMNVIHMLRYRIYAAYLNFPIVLNLVEMASSMQDRSSFLIRINDYLMDNWIIKIFHGALPISDRLMTYYKAISLSKPSLKLPILCDFQKFENVKRDDRESYFLYCGSTAYMPVINFIIEAYNNIGENEDTKLYLIISGGSSEELDQLQQQIAHRTIRIFSDIPYMQLVELYTNALALLIPLRPTLQDSARFPHKIGEYLASGNPVITTNVGEIKNYFVDGTTALIADLYSPSLFAEKMKFVLNNAALSAAIGSNGRKLGLKEFDYRIHGRRLRKFLQELKGLGAKTN